VSFTCHDVEVAELADIEPKRISKLEAKLGAALVAVRQDTLFHFGSEVCANDNHWSTILKTHPVCAF